MEAEEGNEAGRKGSREARRGNSRSLVGQKAASVGMTTRGGSEEGSFVRRGGLRMTSEGKGERGERAGLRPARTEGWVGGMVI